MLLHNLYAIATPGTWNGSPDADPCAPVVDDEPDGMAVVHGDASIDEPDPAAEAPEAGCGCHAQGGNAWPLFVLVLLMLRRRPRR